MKTKYSLVRIRTSRRRFIPSILAAAVAMLLANKPLQAAGGSWNVDNLGNWSATGNWNPAAVPGTAAGDVVNLQFNIGAARTVTLDSVNAIVGDLNIGDSGATLFGYTLAASGTGKISLDGTGAADGTIDFTAAIANSITAPITLVDNGVIRSNVNTQHSINGIISGAKALTFNNDVNGTANPAGTQLGQFALGGANTYTGGTNISDVRVGAGVAAGFGTATVSVTGAGQAFLSGAVTYANAMNLNSTGWIEGAVNFGALRIDNGTLSGAVTLQRHSTIGSNTANSNNITGVVQGPNNLTKIGGGLIVLSGNNTYAGVTTVSDGTLRLNSATALGNSYGVIVENAENPAASNSNILQLAGGRTYGDGKTVVLRNNSTANISNARAVIENQAGNNTWAGTIMFDGGANQAIITSAGIMTISGTITNSANPPSSIFVRGGGTGVINGAILLGDTTLVKTETGVWTVNTTGNTHGNVVIGNGTLVAGVSDAFQSDRTLLLGEGNGNNCAFSFADGATQSFSSISTSNVSSGSHGLTGLGSLDIGSGGITLTVFNGAALNDLTVSAAVIGSGTLTKTGAGTTVFNTSVQGAVDYNDGVLAGNLTTPSLTMGATATLLPGTALTTGTITVGSLALNGGGIAVNIGSLGSDVITVTNSGGLTQSGVSTISISPNGVINTASTFYPVISYTGASPGTAGFTVSGLPPRAMATVTDQGSAIGITATNDRIVWNGDITSTWQVGPDLNWQLESAPATKVDFQSRDYVVFNNAGLAWKDISLSGVVDPSAVEFAHTSDTYTLVSGTLAGSGTMALKVTGAGGTTVLKNLNTYTGTTSVANGATLEVDHTTGTLTGTSVVQVDTGGTFKITRENGADFTFNRAIAGTGKVLIDLNKGGAFGSRTASIAGNSTDFSGVWDLAPSGTYLTNGTFRALLNNANQLGTGSVIARDGGQLWLNGPITVSNSLTLTGAGFQEAGGGTPVVTANLADGSTISGPSLAYGGIGAVRMENNGVLAGNITLIGDTKIMPYNATATISGNITNTASTDDLVFGGGGTGSNLFLTGDNSALERIWVNGGGTAGTNQLLVGNLTTTGSLGSGEVVLYQDAAAAILRFQRSDGYTLGAGQKIIAAHNGTATNLSKSAVISNTTGAGLVLNGATIDLSDGTNAGNLSVAGFGGGNAVNDSKLTIDAGSTVEIGALQIGNQTNFSGTLTQTGGSVTALNNFLIGHYPGSTSSYNLSGGTVTLTATPVVEPSNAAETVGTVYLGADGTGIFNMSGGILNTAAVVLDNRGASPGADQFNLTGGTLELRTSYGLIGRNTDAVISLAGGTIKNVGTAVDVSINGTNINTANSTTLDTTDATNKFSLMGSITGAGTILTVGGGVIELEPDSATTKNSVSTGTGNQSISAVLAGTSAFTKIGSGTTILSAANLYSGVTTVSAGRLNLTGSLANSDLIVEDLGTQLGEGSAKSIAFGTLPTDQPVLLVDASTSGALTSTGTLTVAGKVEVELSSVPAASGPIKVLNHGGTAATAANFTLFNDANFRAVTFTVGATDVTLAFDKKDLTWDGTTATWETGGADNDWNGATPENFFSGDSVLFDDTLVTANQVITMSAGLLPSAVTVNNSAYDYSLTGGGITGNTGIVKDGSKQLTLGGANSYTGGITIKAGRVELATNQALGASGNVITVKNNGQLDFNGVAQDGSRSYTVDITGAGPDGTGAIRNDTTSIVQNSRIINVVLSGDASVGAYGGTGDGNRIDMGLGGTISGNGFTFTKVGDAMVNVRGAATDISYVVTSGILRAEDNDLALGSTGVIVNNGARLETHGARTMAVPLTLNDGSRLNSANSNGNWTGPISTNGTVSIGGAGMVVISGNITETTPTTLVKTETSTSVLTGTNNYSGGTIVDAGILRISSDAALGASPGTADADNLILRNGGRIQAGSATVGVDLTIDANRGVTLTAGDGGFHVWGATTLNYAGAVTGAGNFTKTDGGIFNYSGIANHIGTTISNGGGTWNLNGATISATSSLRGLTGTLNINSGTTITTARFITGDGDGAKAIVNLNGGTINITGALNADDTNASLLLGHWGANGASSLFNVSAGQLNASAAELKLGWDTSLSSVIQTGGVVNVLGLDLANGRNNAASYNLVGGKLNLGASGISAATQKTVNTGGGTLGAFADWSTSQPILLTGVNGKTTVNTLNSVDNTTPQNITISGVLSGAGGLIKTGAGTLNLSGANTYTDNTIVNEGTLSLNGGGGQFGTIRGTLTANNGAVVRLNTVDATGYNATTRLSSINLVGATMDVAVIDNQTLGKAAINLTGGAITGILGSNLDFFAGDGTINSAINSLASATTSTISSTQLKIRQMGGLTLTAADGTTANGIDLDISSVIALDAAFAGQPLIKKGAGTVRLSAINTVDSNTSIAEGELLLTGSVAGTATVDNGATLSGNGTVAGAVTVASGGNVSPGYNDVNTLNFNGGLTLNAGSNYRVGITSATTNDKLNTGVNTLTANGNIVVTLVGYVPSAGDAFDIADAGTTVGSPTFDFTAAPLGLGLSWDTTEFATNGKIKVTGSDPYSDWATAKGLTGADAAKSADPDNDGVPNLLEFATNADPTSASSRARVYGKMHALGGDKVLTLTIAVRKSASFAASGSQQQATKDGVKYIVEASADLNVWNSVVVTELNPGDSSAVQAAITPALPTLESSWEWHTFRTDNGAAVDPRDFVRLRVTDTP